MKSHLNSLGIFILRLGAGGMMLSHGVPKIGMLFGGGEIQFADPFGFGATASLAMAVFAEVICSVLVILGVKIRLAVIPLIITMLVAAFYVHLADPFGRKELALLYGLIFLSFMLTGAGRFSLDSMRNRA